MFSETQHESKTKLPDGALHLIRAKGYAATTVEDISHKAGVTKYVDFRREILQGELPEHTCLLGTMVQEIYATHPDIRAACDQALSSHVDDVLLEDIKAAKKLYAPKATRSAEGLGYFIQSVLQGGFIFAKAKQNPNVARESLSHLRHYLEAVFNQPNPGKRKDKAWAPQKSPLKREQTRRAVTVVLCGLEPPSPLA
jgi:TetR/AcrR family transcriptional repressor of nem operon